VPVMQPLASHPAGSSGLSVLHVSFIFLPNQGVEPGGSITGAKRLERETGHSMPFSAQTENE
jgi:hypothetical protein